MSNQVPDVVGVVVIGRNEGDRLLHCLESVLRQASKVVYVDSGSTDNSIECAKDLGSTVVSLDLSLPFSAGRARNAGFSSLIESYPDIGYVQFVDGDCILSQDWLMHAVAVFEEKHDVSIVCGRRREISPAHSIFNMMCDIEWDTPVGYAESCGGDFLVRASIFQSIGGFNDAVIAGEEPEMCYRLRKTGGKVYRANFEMTLHDAQMDTFSQWWKRTLRSGHAYMQCLYLHRKSPNSNDLRSVISILFWGGLLPVVTVLSVVFDLAALVALIVFLYIYLVSKIYYHVRKSKKSRPTDSLIFSIFTTIGKIPQFFGVLKFITTTIVSGHPRIIEYK